MWKAPLSRPSAPIKPAWRICEDFASGVWLQMLNCAVMKMYENGTLTELSKKWYNGLDPTVKE